MAAKTTKPKSVPEKGKAKPAVKPSKPVAAAKKKPLVKAAAIQKKATPVAGKKPVTKDLASPAKDKRPAKTPAPQKKPATAAEKKPGVKAAAPAKKPAPTVNKQAAVKTLPQKPLSKSQSPIQKSPPLKKIDPQETAKKTSPSTKTADKTSAPAPVTPVAEATSAEIAAKPPTQAKKPAVVKSRSSVVDFPAPPAPVRPPFVPPKAPPAHSDGPVAPGSNGTHSAAFVQKQRQRLLDLRDDLVDAVSGMARDTIRNAPEGSEASGSGQHQGDAGSDAYDRDFALSVLAKEQDALYEIEQALNRIKQGAYGICEISARKIPQARLEAIPFARLTVECQAQWEKEYGNRRFRPSNEVGFSGGNYVEDDDSESVSLDEDDD
jgi:DnaK suppressor protein